MARDNTDFHITDEEEEGREVEEEEEQEEAEEGEEGEEEGEQDDPTVVGSAAHRRARGDTVAEEEEGEDADLTADDYEAIARGGDSRRVDPRIKELIEQRDRAVQVGVELTERIASLARPAAAAKDEPKPYDFKAKQREANKLLLDGDEEAAAAIQDEMNEERQKLADARAEERAGARVAAALEEDRAVTVIADGFIKFPFLDDTNDKVEHNPEALADVMMYRNRYMAEGLSKSAAIAKAINKVGPMYAKVEEGEEEEEDEDQGGQSRRPGKPAAKPSAGGSKVDASIRERIRQRTLANARMEKRQPPQLSRAGVATKDRINSKQDVETMTDEQFDKLTAEEKSNLRGDRVSA
jgi:hypothetical protein